MKRTSNIANTDCPKCGKTVDGAICVTEQNASPTPGDFTICAYCAVPLRFDDQLKLKRISNKKFRSLPEGLRKTMKTAQKMILSHNSEQEET